jgi:hypothetical protein
MVCLIASLERGSHFADYPVLRAGEDCDVSHEPLPPSLA